jgi:predicted DNA-binding protein
MTDQYSDQQVVAAAAAFRNGDVTYDEGALVQLPPVPEEEPMVTRGVRLPVGLDQRMRAAAQEAGVPFSQLIREWIEVGLTDLAADQTVSLAALRRAIAHAAQSAATPPKSHPA